MGDRDRASGLMTEALSDDRCWLELDGLEVGHLAVVSQDEPYVTPISFVSIGESIRFRTVSGRRLDAMAAGSRVCIEASQANPATGAWVSIIAWGTMRPVVTDADEQETIQALLRKYHTQREDPFRLPAPSPLQPRVVIIDVDRISGRSSGLGLRPALRPGRL